MCFGAGASFAASAVLAAAGGATLRKVRAKNELLFGLFPALFAVHQFNEGLLWLVLTGKLPPEWEHVLTLSFLFVAFFVWPVLAPLSVYLLEPTAKRRKMLLPFVAFGAGLGVVLLYYLLSGPFAGTIMNCSLYYRTLVPEGKGLTALYLIAVFVPFFLSTYRPVVVIGVINIIFCGVAYFFYIQTFVSTWCFFASALSVMVYLFFCRLHHQKTPAARLDQA